MGAAKQAVYIDICICLCVHRHIDISICPYAHIERDISICLYAHIEAYTMGAPRVGHRPAGLYIERLESCFLVG